MVTSTPDTTTTTMHHTEQQPQIVAEYQANNTYLDLYCQSCLKAFPLPPPDDPPRLGSPSNNPLAPIFQQQPHHMIRDFCSRTGPYASTFAGIDHNETLEQYNNRKRYWRSVFRTLMVIPERELREFVDTVVAEGQMDYSVKLPSKSPPGARFSALAKSMTNKIVGATTNLNQPLVDVRMSSYVADFNFSNQEQHLLIGDTVRSKVVLLNMGSTKANFSVAKMQWIGDDVEKSPVSLQVHPVEGSIPKGGKTELHVSLATQSDLGFVNELLVVNVEKGPRMPLLIKVKCCKPVFAIPLSRVACLELSPSCGVPIPLLQMTDFVGEHAAGHPDLLLETGTVLDEGIRAVKHHLETGRFGTGEAVAVGDVVSTIKLWLEMLPALLLDHVIFVEEVVGETRACDLVLENVTKQEKGTLHALVEMIIKFSKLFPTRQDEYVQLFVRLLTSDEAAYSNVTSALSSFVQDPALLL